MIYSFLFEKGKKSNNLLLRGGRILTTLIILYATLSVIADFVMGRPIVMYYNITPPLLKITAPTDRIVAVIVVALGFLWAISILIRDTRDIIRMIRQ